MEDLKENKLKIFYEDNHIIVVEKIVNLPSQADSSKDIDMVTLIKEYLKEKYKKPGNVYLGLVHRLDRPVGGIMVFAKTSKAAARLTEGIKKHKFHKKYIAVVEGNLKEKEGTFIDYIEKDKKNNAIITSKGKGKYAELKYKVIKEKEGYTLVDILLVTGRHHQIRIQFKNRNHPLYGDQRYGKQNKKQIALYAYKLEFIHPVKKEKMTFVNYPNTAFWKTWLEQ